MMTLLTNILAAAALNAGVALSAQDVTLSVPGDFSDLQEAFNAASKMRAGGSNVTVEIAPGTYCITRPLSFTSEGSVDAVPSLSVKGAGAGRTIISSARELPPFSEASDGLWTIDLAGIVPPGGMVQQLFVNGRRSVLAQSPDFGLFYLTGAAEETLLDEVGERKGGRRGFAAQSISIPDDAAAVLSKPGFRISDDLIVSFYHAWDVTTRYVDSFDPAGKKLFVSGSRMKSWNRMDRCSQFVLKNSKAFLDAPGEYYFDKNAAVLYYLPYPGESVADSHACIPVAGSLLVIRGEEHSHAGNISFEGISFEHTAHAMGRYGNDPQQAAASVEAAVMLDFADNVEFVDCEISHTANSGIWFRKACRDCGIRHSYIHDIGAGAVKIGDIAIPADEELLLTRNITVDNNILREGGRVFETGVGVTLFQASDCRITHNEVADFYYSGMSIGWLWGYNHSPSKRNKVLYNHIHHIGWGFLSDMGGVYTLGPSEGTEVSHNVIHDIYSFGYGGWGLYTDEGSTGIRMEYNLVYNCKSSGFHQHYGKENIIRNNIFVNNIVAQLEATREEPHLSFTFTNNIICYNGGKMYGIKWDKANSVVDSNLYWHAGEDVDFNGLGLKEWQSETGKDLHSVIADPGIRTGDYHPTNRKALRKIGFEQFDWSEVGVYGDAGWLDQARYSSDRAALYDSTVERYLRQ